MKSPMLSTLRYLKRVLECTFGIRILKKLPRGLSFLSDVVDLPWTTAPKLIIDVGANSGQSAIPLAKAFPLASIICFEPSEQTFRTLSAKTKGYDRIQCHQLGLSSSEGEASLVLTDDPTMHHIATELVGADRIERIALTTLDKFCNAYEIECVDILKIDTEGHDLAVLEGAHGLLSGGRVRVVYCETSMNAQNRFHAPLEEILRLMTSHGYYLFGVYEQVDEWTLGRPYLRRANVAFISSEIAEFRM